jgi:phosphomannomutase
MDDPSAADVSCALPVLQTPVAYVCPGEDHPIPRSIHLARLAAYYPKCRECEHRRDTGQLPRSTVGRLEQTAARVVKLSPFGPEGVRGEYLNHITRQIAGRVAEAVADRCWQSQPLAGRVPSFDDEAELADHAAQTGPVIVIGHDARPTSPDLCVGVGSALRRMGCEVVDVGRVSGPCHTFAVDHLHAEAGVFVTGCGHPPQWTGIDLTGPRGVPWSMGGSIARGVLLDVERRFLNGVSRPTRQGGTQRYFDAVVPYRASLLKHFRDLRPLRVVCALQDEMLRQTLQQIFEPLPCDLIVIDAPPVTDRLAAGDPVRRAFRVAIKQADAACGIAVGEDNRGIAVFDEQGKSAPMAALFARLINEQRGARRLMVCVNDDDAELLAEVEQRCRSVEQIVTGREGLAKRLFDPVAGFGIEPGGRLWLKDPIPICDAALTIGLLVRTLSRANQPLSGLLSSN